MRFGSSLKAALTVGGCKCPLGLRPGLLLREGWGSKVGGPAPPPSPITRFRATKGAKGPEGNLAQSFKGRGGGGGGGGCPPLPFVVPSW